MEFSKEKELDRLKIALRLASLWTDSSLKDNSSRKIATLIQESSKLAKLFRDFESTSMWPISQKTARPSKALLETFKRASQRQAEKYTLTAVKKKYDICPP